MNVSYLTLWRCLTTLNGLGENRNGKVRVGGKWAGIWHGFYCSNLSLESKQNLGVH